MPQYDFEDKDGNLVTLTLTTSEYTRRCKNGVLRHRGKKLTRYMGPTTTKFQDTPGNWPARSTVMGITNPTPARIKAAVEKAAAKGIEINFDRKTGECILKDAATRRAYAEMCGLHDLNSYGTHGDARFNGKIPDTFKENEIPIPDVAAYERLKAKLDQSPSGKGFGHDTHPAFRREGNKLIVDPKYMKRLMQRGVEANLRDRGQRERAYEVRTS